MKVCMLTSAHSPVDVRIFHKEAKSLRKGGYDVTIIAPATPSIRTNVTIAGIKILVIPRYKTKFLRPLTLLQLVTKGLKENADLYHCHEPDALIAGTTLKLLKRRKLIYDAHEYWSDFFSEKFPNSIRSLTSFCFEAAERIPCIFADHILAASEEIAEYYRLHSKQATLIANFPTMEFFEAGEKKGLADKYAGKTIFVYVGGMAQNRGILESTKALELMGEKTDAYLLLVGPFKNAGYEKEVIAYVKERWLREKVEFRGSVQYADVPAYLRIGKAGLLLLQPTERYVKTPYPIKLFEYMGYGLPAIVSNFPHIKKIVEEANCGILVDPTNPEDVAKAMTWVIENPAAAESMGKNGRKAVEEKYNWQKMEKRLLDVYGSLLAKRK